MLKRLALAGSVVPISSQETGGTSVDNSGVSLTFLTSRYGPIFFVLFPNLSTKHRRRSSGGVSAEERPAGRPETIGLASQPEIIHGAIKMRRAVNTVSHLIRRALKRI